MFACDLKKGMIVWFTDTPYEIENVEMTFYQGQEIIAITFVDTNEGNAYWYDPETVFNVRD